MLSHPLTPVPLTLALSHGGERELLLAVQTSHRGTGDTELSVSAAEAAAGVI